MPIFSSSDLGRIKRNTNKNFHGENYVFIAKKIKSPLLQDFVSINKEHEKAGYLTHELSEKRYALFEKLMKELAVKSSVDYEEVKQRL